MARGGRSGQRDANNIANPNSPDPLGELLAPPSPMPSIDPSPLPDPLNEVSDGRLWNPLGELRPAVSIDGNNVSIGIGRSSYIIHRRPIVARSNTLWSPSGLPVGLQFPVGTRFESPLRVMVCVRRKIRRQVMFAKKKVGRGAKKKFRRHNRHSGVSC